MDQNHLTYKDAINYGSYYTPKWLVDIVYEILLKNVKDFSQYYILDTSCGYGGFLRGNNAIGADIDKVAIKKAKADSPSYSYFNHNSLLNISRTQYNLSNKDKIIIIGNPPYNDTTSIIRNDIKQEKFLRDTDVFSRDLGISFLLSYAKMQADYICVLHPLSYLIKKTNFESLGKFKDNYILQDSVIVSSGVFNKTSKKTSFPIIIAFYKRFQFGMNYDYIRNYTFKTYEGKLFSIEQYDKICNYVTKYPNQKSIDKDKTVAYFWTMRDINALKRTKTFVNGESYNTIRITQNKLPYYCYVDIFKEYISHIPYYFGNSEIMIDNSSFDKLKNIFMNKCSQKYPEIKQYVISPTNTNYSQEIIDDYFKKLLGEHYVD